MTRIGTVFARARAEERAVFLAYICGGDPSLEATTDLLLATERAGVDVVELGVPFSDPTADGPTIEQASVRALSSGASYDGVLTSLQNARDKGFSLPVVLFGYYNPILAQTEDVAIDKAKAAGVDAFLVVDLPIEEAGEFVGKLRKRSMSFVPLVAPTSGEIRAGAAAQLADDFIYYVSMTGVTGGKTDLAAAAEKAAGLGRSLAKDVALGFGIKTPADVALVAPHVAGVVVGSAIVACHADSGLAATEALMASLAKSTDRGSSNAKSAP